MRVTPAPATNRRRDRRADPGSDRSRPHTPRRITARRTAPLPSLRKRPARHYHHTARRTTPVESLRFRSPEHCGASVAVSATTRWPVPSARSSGSSESASSGWSRRATSSCTPRARCAGCASNPRPPDVARARPDALPRRGLARHGDSRPREHASARSPSPPHRPLLRCREPSSPRPCRSFPAVPWSPAKS